MMAPVCAWIPRLSILLGLLLSVACPGDAVPAKSLQIGGKGGGKKQLTAQQRAAKVPQGISTATDGSTILDTTVNIK
jgi:hypothetical protein